MKTEEKLHSLDHMLRAVALVHENVPESDKNNVFVVVFHRDSVWQGGS